jgi:transposase
VTEQELARGAARRLAIIRHAQEVTGNISLTCRYFGITRQAYYTWLRRYEEQGVEGLRDRSRRPHVSPNATKAEVVGKIVYLRQHYHFGPHKIAMYLKRYHDVQVSPSGIWRILKRLDMSRLPASQRYRRHTDRWKRYEKPLPGHRVQIDVKFIAPLPGSRRKHYQFTAIDDCARIRVLRLYDRLNQTTAIRFVDYVLEKLPFKVEVIQTRPRVRVRLAVPLPRPGPGDRARLHQAGHPQVEREGRAVPPDRRRGVLPDAPGHRDRRHGLVQRATEGVGGLLQLQPAARNSRGPDAV